MTFLAILITFSVIILVHEWGHFIAARRIGVKVERFSLGFGPKLLGVKRGDTEYTLCLFPIGGYVKMEGESADAPGPQKPWQYRSRSVGERFGIVAAGPVMNYLFGFLVFTLIFTIGAPLVSISTTTEIGQVVEGYPAQSAGIQAGDKVLTVNGAAVSTWQEVTETIHAQRERVELTIERKGEALPQPLAMIPKVEEVMDEKGQRVTVGMVGIAPAQMVSTVRYPFPKAMWRAAEQIWTVTILTVRSLWWVAVGRLSVKETLTGPIGIFFITDSVASQGAIHLLHLMGLLSTALGFFNFLPIPILDGGHLAFLIAEKIKGKPVGIKTQEVMSWVGLGLIGALLITVSYNDIMKYKDRFFQFVGQEE